MSEKSSGRERGKLPADLSEWLGQKTLEIGVRDHSGTTSAALLRVLLRLGRTVLAHREAIDRQLALGRRGSEIHTRAQAPTEKDVKRSATPGG
jgi:hypothetical protein